MFTPTISQTLVSLFKVFANSRSINASLHRWCLCFRRLHDIPDAAANWCAINTFSAPLELSGSKFTSNSAYHFCTTEGEGGIRNQGFIDCHFSSCWFVMRSSQKFTLRLTIVSLSLPTGVQRIDRTGLDKTRYQLYSEARLMSSEVSKVLFKWTTVVFRSFSNNTKNGNFWRGTFYIVRSLSGSLVFFGLHLCLHGLR